LKKKRNRVIRDDVHGPAKLRRKSAAEEAHDKDAVETDKTAAADSQASATKLTKPGASKIGSRKTPAVSKATCSQWYIN
jgi:hypothetical protein